MTTFTIEPDNNITAHPTPELAAAATAAGAQSFGSQPELAHLAASWPAERLVEIWNSLLGEAPVKKFQNPKTAISRIWERIQHLGEPPKPKPERKTSAGAQVAQGAPAKAKANKKATPAKKAHKPPKKATVRKAEGVREGSKTAQVVAMLQREFPASVRDVPARLLTSFCAVRRVGRTHRRFVIVAWLLTPFAVASFGWEGYRSPAGLG